MSDHSHKQASAIRLELDAAHALHDALLPEISFGLRSSVAPGGVASEIIDRSAGIAPGGTAPAVTASGAGR